MRRRRYLSGGSKGSWDRVANTMEQAKPKPVAATKDKKEETKSAASDPLNTTSMFEEGFLANLHKPGGNYQIIPENREKHLKETGGKVYTRFPPEVGHDYHHNYHMTSLISLYLA